MAASIGAKPRSKSSTSRACLEVRRSVFAAHWEPASGSRAAPSTFLRMPRHPRKVVIDLAFVTERLAIVVLQGSETVEHGNVKGRWSVVARSGTGELAGLRGEGGFEGEFGKGSDGSLEYWFE